MNRQFPQTRLSQKYAGARIMNYKGATTEFTFVCVCVCVCVWSSQNLSESRSRLELLEKRNARRDLPDRACSSVCSHSDCFWMQKNSSMMRAEVLDQFRKTGALFVFSWNFLRVFSWKILREKPENTPKKRRESFCKFRGCKEVPVREVTSRQKNCEKGAYIHSAATSV